MARIPIERNTGGGAWWWVLVIAVIGLVVWLVYEWFDRDYYDDYGYAAEEGVRLEQRDEAWREEWGMQRRDGAVGDDYARDDLGYGVTPVPTGEPSQPIEGEQPVGAQPQDYGMQPGTQQGMGAQQGMGQQGVVTNLQPVVQGDAWQQYVGRPVQVGDLQVQRAVGPQAFTVDVNGESVLVVSEDASVSQTLQSGQRVHVLDGRLQRLDDPNALQQRGVDPSMLQDERFFIHADRIQVVG